MKRKYLALSLALCILLVLSASVLLVACNRNPQTATADTTTVYDMRLDYDGGRTATLDADVLYCNTTGRDLDEIRFHLYPNAFSEGSPNPPYNETDKSDFFYNGESFGKIEVLSVKTDRTSVDFALSDNKQILSVPCDAKAGDFVAVSFECLLTLPECISRFGVTPDGVNLTGFYPSVCVFENGEWREDAYTAIGDPFYSEIASFYVTVSMPESFVLASSGTVAESGVSDGKTTVYVEAENVRDFAVCLSEKFTRDYAEFETGGNTVRVEYCFVDDAEPERTLALAVNAVRTFSETFGAYPYPALTVVQSPLNAGGMEYGTLVIVAPSEDRTVYEQTVVHEIAHQWWFGVVGSDQINCAWLDEGLTEFCTAYFYALSGDDDTYTEAVAACRNYYAGYERLPEEIGFDGRMSRPLCGFLAEGEYVAVTYMKGFLLFDALLQVAGREKFNAALSDYFASNAYSIATPDDLVASFENQGILAGGIVDSFVSDKAII